MCAYAEVSFQLTSEDALDLQGIQVWILHADKAKSYTSKQYYKDLKPHYTDENGRVQTERSAEDLEELRVVVYDPRVEMIDRVFTSPDIQAEMKLPVKGQPYNGRIKLNLSSIPPTQDWRNRWESTSPREWLITLRLKDEQEVVHLLLANYQKDLLHLYGLPDGRYTVELLTFSKFKSGGDGFLHAIEPENQPLILENGRLQKDLELKLRLP